MELTKNELKKILKEQREEYQRYIGVATEEFASQAKGIAEMVLDLQRIIKDFYKEFVELRKIVEQNSRDIAILREMVAKNTEDIEIIKSDIQWIKQELRRKVDKDEFEQLERRVLLLERKAGRAVA